MLEGKQPLTLHAADQPLTCRHYEDCWNELAKMFSSTQVLPPRTKRWAEAKVLADCVAFRVSPRPLCC
jgi:hypothetical protein